ncbi:ABC transporter ATP-binding protein [Nisaea acidiphila]|uniref:ABC transporter ATP-binding protein n=1 Tax=Nisaea acidiphila TaxID=1862145 RepID=A0A9J7ATY6_9PROT|nr:ABC transporter ATP-binding protein [Nisaea acidiphila]UUX50783.1 ABC transporter ATP-binding protein [Nisaea acidiphila]
MLEIRGLTSLHVGPVDLDVAAGTCVALRGRSGSGKSLLLRAIADLDPAGGSVALEGNDRGSMPAPDWRRQVGYLPAEPGWWADGVAAHFGDWSACREFAERLGLDPEAGDWSVARLSTGERQRLGLIRLLENKPRCLLLDEPTAALDDAATETVERLVSEHCAAGGCCLFVTHDSSQFARVGARGFRLEDGLLVEEAAS